MFRSRIGAFAVGLALASLASSTAAQSRVELCPCQQLQASVRLGGKVDAYALPVDAAGRGSQLSAAYPSAAWKDFDDAASNRFVGHTFDNLPGDIACATLEIRLRPSSIGSTNDTLYLSLLPAPSQSFRWATRLQELPGAGGDWSSPFDPAVFTFDLAALPATSTSPATSLLDQLNSERRLDLLIQDDTQVDYVKLTLRTFPQRTVSAGMADDFVLPTEITRRSAQLEAAFPTARWKDLDDSRTDRFIGHTFRNLTYTLVEASLEARLKPLTGETSNDTLYLGLSAGPTFAFSSRIKNLPGAGGTWIANPPTTFDLDLTSLLAQINTDDRLDLLIQDDTAADFLRLHYRTCPTSWRFDGVPFDAVARGTFNPLPSIGFTVGTTGNGNDGVGVRVGTADGVHITTLACLSGLGTAYDLAVSGTIETISQTVYSVATESFLNTPSKVDLSVTFPQPYENHLSVTVSNQGTEVSPSFGVVSGLVASLPPRACIKELGYIGTRCFRTLLVSPVAVQIEQGGPLVTGDEIQVCHDTIVGFGMKVSSLSLTTPNATTFPISGAALDVLGISAHGLGAADIVADVGGLTVSDLGPTGADGVALDLGSVSAVSAALAPLDLIGDAPAGSYLEAEALGSVDGVPASSLGTLRISKSDNLQLPFAYDVDYDAIGSPTHRIDVVRENVVIATFSGLVGQVGLSAISPSLVAKPRNHPRGYVVSYPAPTTVLINDQSLQADQLRILSENSSVAIGPLSELQLRATGLGEFTILAVGPPKLATHRD